jgi:hyperosmotically inducible periplasmic protein
LLAIGRRIECIFFALQNLPLSFDPEVPVGAIVRFHPGTAKSRENRRNLMKASQATKVISGALIVVASLNVYAQSSSATSAPATAAAPNTMSTKAANRALQRTVRRALSKTKGLSVANITVRARSGAVTLEGAVPEQSQIDLATQTARAVPGVSSVNNALTVHEIGQ